MLFGTTPLNFWKSRGLGLSSTGYIHEQGRNRAKVGWKTRIHVFTLQGIRFFPKYLIFFYMLLAFS
jgi:hypothetical protein